MKKIIVLFFVFNLIFGQGRGEKIEQAKITYDEKSIAYSNLINITFFSDVEWILEQDILYPNEIKNLELFNLFSFIQKKFGEFYLDKTFPNTSPSDTLKRNFRTGEIVKVPNLARHFSINFNSQVPIQEVIGILSSNEDIETAYGPTSIILCNSPNDPYYTNNSLWNLDFIEASKAWDITRGDPNSVVAVLDFFYSGTRHEDLIDKIVYSQSNNYVRYHGRTAASCVAAHTDNNLGIASLGYNTKLAYYNTNRNNFRSAADSGYPVINCSWISGSGNTPELSDAIEYATALGTIVVAGAGNNEYLVAPQVVYPAAYPNVIAVSATIWWDTIPGGEEDFPGTSYYVNSWNYSPGTNPVIDPVNSFIDFAAPGGPIWVCSPEDYPTEYVQNWGTSLAAPHVSALIALILSINSDLTKDNIYEILKITSEKVGQYPYLYDHNTWNQYLGYGRINAYKALKYVIENYGGNFNQDVILNAGETWNIQPGVTLNFVNGNKLVVNGSLISNNVTFNFESKNSSTQNGIVVNTSGDLTINNAVIKNAYRGIYSDAAAPDIQNSEIYNCEYGLYIKNSNNIYADPIIYDNKIHNNGSMGVYLSNSYARIKGNEVYDHSNYGVVAYNGSSPDFGWPAVEGNNNIHNNRYGLYAHNSSIPLLGRESCTLQAGNNIIANNYVYNIRARDNNFVTIYAENNWWGSSTPDPGKIWISTGASIDYLPALSSPPALNKIQPVSPEEKDFDEQFNDGVQLVHQPDEAASSNYDEKWILDWKMLYVRNLNWAGKFETSKKICEEVIVNNLDSAKVKQFLFLYLQAARKTKEISAYKSFVKNLLPAKNEISKEIEASILLTLNNLETDPSLQISTYDLIDNKFTNHSVAENALYQKFEHFYFDKNDKEKAAKVYEKMKTKYPESYLLEFFELALNSETKDNNEKYINEQTEGYQLIGNYPNPSNPATTIKYSLPYASNVKIEIFDITGSRIRTFEIPAQAAGIQKVSWDGFNNNGISVASGIYIYRFSAVPVGNVGKEFVKSAKIMLLK